MYVALRSRPKERFRDAFVTRWRLASGLSLGMFIFVPADAPRRLLVHEYGHTVQSAMLGPLYLLVVGLPSLLWANVRALSRWRRAHDVSYYALPTERWANWLGERVTDEPSMGQVRVD